MGADGISFGFDADGVIDEIFEPGAGTLITFAANPGGLIDITEPNVFSLRGELLSGGGGASDDTDFPINFRRQPAAIPVPPALALMFGGLVALLGLRRARGGDPG